MPKTVIPEKCNGYILEDRNHSWAAKDVILYAVSVGAGEADPTTELHLTYEHDDGFCPLPTFWTLLPDFNECIVKLIECPGMPAFDPMQLLHGQCEVRISSPPESSGSGRVLTTIHSVEDKKKGALISMMTELKDSCTGSVLVSVKNSLFIRGIGGFSNSSASSLPIPPEPKLPAPETSTFTTRPAQALIYRLNGDSNPLHIDPNMASLGGFQKPILHGLCTFGICTREILKSKNIHPSEVCSMSVRFTSPVVPGEQISIAIHELGRSNFMYTASVGNRKAVWGRLSAASRAASL